VIRAPAAAAPVHAAQQEVEVGNGQQAAAGRARESDERGTTLERMRDPSRVLALSDGVFAIIMTLLVLDIRVPHLAKGESLASALRGLGPSLTAFVISFIVAAMYWVGHRDLFGLVRRADRGLVWLNLVYLLPLCLMPFGAGLLARHDREPAALRIYGLILLRSRSCGRPPGCMPPAGRTCSGGGWTIASGARAWP
jgi:hypothetical protein